MNIQDIADFMDLVKNPAKYDALLQRLVDEQARLKAVIATVGEVAEIEQIKKDLLKQEAEATTSYQEMQKMFSKEQEKGQKAIEVNLAELKTSQAVCDKQSADLKDVLAENKSINADIKKREKALIKQEQTIQETQDALLLTKVEYEEKLAKLKSVMV